MLERLKNWLRMVRDKMFGQQSFYNKAGVPDHAIADEMVLAIDRWCNLYLGKADWLAHNSISLGLPATIASLIATMVTLEMEAKVVPVNGGSAERAEYLDKTLDKIRDCIQQQTEYACAKGGLVFKPYVDDDEVCFDFVQADDFYPCAFNSKGEITSAVFLSRKKDGRTFFTRVEKHIFENGICTITNKAFRGRDESDLGEECSLAEVSEWDGIEPEVNIQCDHPLFAYFRVPLGNTIDPKSPLGVSVFSRADQNDLLREADKQFQRFVWEFEGGELAIDASRDAFKSVGGVPQIPEGRERLFRMNNIDGSDNGSELLKTFSPTLRDQSLINGMQEILKKVEDACGLTRGQLSDPEPATARTAYEIKMTKQKSYATVTSIQRSLEAALKATVAAADIMCSLYHLAPEGDYDMTFVWDDSIIVDAESERMRDMQEVQQGLMQPWEFRAKWYGEEESKAKAMVAKQPSDDELMGFQTTKKPIPPESQRKPEE